MTKQSQLSEVVAALKMFTNAVNGAGSGNTRTLGTFHAHPEGFVGYSQRWLVTVSPPFPNNGYSECDIAENMSEGDARFFAAISNNFDTLLDLLEQQASALKAVEELCDVADARDKALREHGCDQVPNKLWVSEVRTAIREAKEKA